MSADEGIVLSSVPLHEVKVRSIGEYYIELELAKGRFNLKRSLRIEDLRAEFDFGEDAWFVYVPLASGGGIRMELMCTRRVDDRPGFFLDGIKEGVITWRISL